MTLSLTLVISALMSTLLTTHAFASCEDDWDQFTKQLQLGTSVQASGFNLQGHVLNDYNLTDANLKRVDFRRTQLRNTNFTGANLTQADFRHADLTKAQLNRAILNGARFEGAILYDVNYKCLHSAKGTIFEDLMALTGRVHDAADKKRVLKKQNDPLFSILLTGTHSLQSLYQTIEQGLSQRQARNQSQTWIHFEGLQFIQHDQISSPLCVTRADIDNLIQEYTKLLKSRSFERWVAHVTVDHFKNCLYVKLKSNYLKLAPSFIDDCTLNLSAVPVLDLHPNKPKKAKRKHLHRFIMSFALKRYSRLEIITGRGLQNRDGIMGRQWKWCQKILMGTACKPYIDFIQSENKQGSWLVILREFEPERQAYRGSKNGNKRALKRSVYKQTLKTINNRPRKQLLAAQSFKTVLSVKKSRHKRDKKTS